MDSKLLDKISKLRRENKDPTKLIGYLEATPAFDEYIKSCNKHGNVHMENEWGDHIRANLASMVKEGSIEKLQGIGTDSVAILVGASPDLKKNARYLKDIEGEHRKRFIVIAVNSAMTYLESLGIVPDYIIAADADRLLWDRDLKPLKYQEKYTLLLNSIAHPSIAENWKGKLLWLPMACMDDKANSLLQHALKTKHNQSGCGNAFNMGFIVAYSAFECRSFFFIGNSLSWKPEKESYYADGKDSTSESGDARMWDALDVWGHTVKTQNDLFQYKLWLEDVTSKFPGYYVNCTEGGIFGVNTDEHNYLPWIQQVELNVAIDKAIEGFEKFDKGKDDWRYMEMQKYNLSHHQGMESSGYPKNTIKELAAKKVLDVGCGEGSSIKEMVADGINAYGCDISEIAARKWNGVADRCKIAFADKLPYKDGEFDLVTTDILEHIPADHVGNSIVEMKRVTNKNLFFLVDFKKSDDLINNKIQPHATIRSPEWWRKTFKRCGLKLVRQPTLNSYILQRR